MTGRSLPPFPARADPVRSWADEAPSRVAVVEWSVGRRWTYGELDALADLWAAEVRGWGGGRGSRVAALLSNRIEHVALLFGCLRAGAALVPLNWRLTATELVPILRDADVVRIVTEPAFRPACDDAVARLGGRPQVLDAGERAGKGRPPAPARGGSRRVVEIPSADDPALVLYTSGSTGRPKGAILPHGQIFANAVATTEGWGLTGSDVAPITTPLFHTGGWNVLATPLWHVGGTVVLLDGFDADDYLWAMAEEGCTVALAVPTQLHVLAQSPAWGRPLPRLRAFMSGGAPCPLTLAKAVRDAGYGLNEGYGLTECGPNCFAQTPEESAARPGWVGRPIPYLDVRLMDSEGRVVEGGGAGELQLSGPQVFAGYLGDPTRTAEAFTGDGWLRTGDVAERSEDGVYRICGRIKEMFISGGENVYPAEVENVLLEHPEISEVAVVPVPDEKWGEVGRAFVVLTEGSVLTPQEVRRFARSRLAAYKFPKTVTFIEALPKLGSGKLDRARLSSMP